MNTAFAHCLAATNCFAIAALTDNGWFALLGCSCLLAAGIVFVGNLVTDRSRP